MTDKKENPLVSFVVIAYNQERFISEAIEGAFAQTYQPLEIILSDDCSTDRTFDIMKEMAKDYDGPHRVVSNRNKRNLGLVQHIDRVMELVSAEFILVNAGDDVSLPERTSRFADIWKSSGRKVKLVHSSALRMDENGHIFGKRTPPLEIIENPTPYSISVNSNWVIGATAAWDRDVFREFGALGEELSVEDHIIPFRASLIGDLFYEDSPQVKHRVGGLTGKKVRSLGYNYLYGGGLKKRKWDIETYNHILESYPRVSYLDKEKAEEECRKRCSALVFSVKLAEANIVERAMMFREAVLLSFDLNRLFPLKDWVRYNFDFLYIPYATWNIRRKAKQQKNGLSELPM